MGLYMDNNVVIAAFYQQLNLKVELKPRQIESQVGGTIQSTRNSITRRTARVMANWALSLQEEYAACRAPFSTTINHARGRNEWERTLIASPKFFSPLYPQKVNRASVCKMFDIMLLAFWIVIRK